ANPTDGRVPRGWIPGGLSPYSRLPVAIESSMTASSLFHPAVAAWFDRTFAAPTAAQAQAWPLIASGRNVLIAAPTGSGKTLAAFMAAIDALVGQRRESRPRGEAQGR